MPPPQYASNTHHLRDEDQPVDGSPPYLSPSRLEPYFLHGFAARQTSSAFDQDGQFMSLMPQSNPPIDQGSGNQYLAPPASLGLHRQYDDGPYYPLSAFQFQQDFQRPNTPQLIVSCPTSYYEGHGMSPGNATGTITGTIGSGTHFHHGSANFSNSINNPSPRSQNYGPNLQASDANFLNLPHEPQQYSDPGSNFHHSRPQQQLSHPVASASNPLKKIACDCAAGFHETKSQQKKCIARQEKPAKCPDCDYASATRNDLQRHIDCLHSSDPNKKHRCPVCHGSRLISRIDNFKNHLETIHGDTLSEGEILEYVKQSKERVAAYRESLPKNIPHLGYDDSSNQGQLEHDGDTSSHEVGTYDLQGSFDGTNTASDITSNTASWMGTGEYNMETINHPTQSLDGDADLMDEDTSPLHHDGFLTYYPGFANGYQAMTQTSLQPDANMAQASGLLSQQEPDYTNYQAASRRPSLAYSNDNADSTLTPVYSSQRSAAASRPSMEYTQPTSTYGSGYFDTSLSRTTSREEHAQPNMHERSSSSSTVPQMSATRPVLRQITTGPPTNHHNLVGQRTDRELSQALEVLAARGLVAKPRGQTVEPASVSPLSGKENSRHAEEEDPNCNTCQTLRRKNKMSDLRKHLIRVNKWYFCTWPKCNKRCGSKDEQKKHANSQHYHVGEWWCGLPLPTQRQPHRLCQYHTFHRHSFINHVNDKHADVLSQGQTAADIMKDCVKNGCFPREMWCGHCRCWRKLKGNDKEIWDGWWNHVEDHLLGRKEMPQQKAEEWERKEGAKPQRMMTLDCDSQDQSQPKDQSSPKVQCQSSIPQAREQFNLAFRGGPVAASPAIEALRKPKRRATSSPERRPSNKKTGSRGRSGKSQAILNVVCCQCNWILSADDICVNPNNCQHVRCMGCDSDNFPRNQIRDDDDD